MKTIVFISLTLFLTNQLYGQDIYEINPNLSTLSQQIDTVNDQLGIAVYPELLGKGFYSLNVDFPIKANHRFSVGLTALDYDIEEYENFQVGEGGALTAGLMYYYLKGKRRSFLELGVGVSLFHRLGVDYHNDSPISLHGVIGYRYQKKDGLLFRVGFTPFLRVNNWFLPLVGISLGYSW
ncbi:MAG: hypothetical protein K8R58_05180 [Bacteroidales bacterium]|nr:hypothetical protein [Bacteroidales bacterium]